MGKSGNRHFIFLGSKITVDGDCSWKIKKCLLLGRKAMTNLDSVFKSRDITLPTKARPVKAMVLQQSRMSATAEPYRWLSTKKLMLLNCGAGEDSWESSDYKEINQSVLKETNLEHPLEGLMLKMKTSILWPPDMKSQLIGQDLDAGKDSRQKEKGMGENDMVRQHHWLNGQEFEQTPGDSEGQRSLACCSTWGHKESDLT